jgi:hypothetical protein
MVLGVFFRRRFFQPKKLVKGIVPPHARGRAAKPAGTAGKGAPYSPRILYHGLADPGSSLETPWL